MIKQDFQNAVHSGSEAFKKYFSEHSEDLYAHGFSALAGMAFGVGFAGSFVAGSFVAGSTGPVEGIFGGFGALLSVMGAAAVLQNSMLSPDKNYSLGAAFVLSNIAVYAMVSPQDAQPVQDPCQNIKIIKQNDGTAKIKAPQGCKLVFK